MGVVPEGGEQFAALSRALHNAGEIHLGRALDEAFRRPLKDLIPALQASQWHAMHKRGGMAVRARAATKYSVRKVTTGRYPGMRLTARAPARISRQNAGTLRHPVFADQAQPREDWEWVNQRIPAGWFDDPARAAQPAIRRTSEAALRDVVRQIDIDMSGAGGALAKWLS